MIVLDMYLVRGATSPSARSAAPPPASDARTRIPSRSSAFGSTRWPARIVARAISPYASSSANAGTGTSAGRESTRPSVDANSAFVTGFGDTRFTGPCRPVVASACSIARNVVVQRDPAHPLTTAADRPAHAQTEREQQPLQRPTVGTEHDPGAEQYDAHSRIGGGHRRRLPFARHPREEIAAQRALLVQRLVAPIAVDADRRCRSAARAADAPARRWCAPELRAAHATLTDRALSRRAPAMRERLAGEMDHRIRALEIARRQVPRIGSHTMSSADCGRAVRTSRRTRTLRARRRATSALPISPVAPEIATNDEEVEGAGSVGMARRRSLRARPSFGRRDAHDGERRIGRTCSATAPDSAGCGARSLRRPPRSDTRRPRCDDESHAPARRALPRAPAASRRPSRRDCAEPLCSDRGCMSPPSSKYRPPVRTT